MTTAQKVGGKANSLRPIALTVLIATVSLAASAYADNPNFIFILVDDLGYTDIACAGNGNDLDTTYYKTPNIAKLRAKGTRFTNAYVTAPFCKPTRASIMTGKYIERLKIVNVPGRLGLYEMTIAEALDAGGTDYLSASVGKWSLSKPSQPPQPRDALPNRQGFDYNYGGSSRLYPDETKEGRFEKADGTDGWDPNDYPGLGDPNNDPCLNEYLTDSITTRAIEFMHTAVEANTPKPFFLYLAYYSLHKPIQAKQSDWEYVKDSNNGWTPDNDPPPNGDSNSTYAAMIKNLDDNVGRILEAIDANHLNIAGDTVIVFYSDDGGEDDFTSNRPLHSDKGGLYEGGIRVPLIIRWPGHTADSSTCDKPVSSIDFFPTILDIVYGSGYTAGRYPVIDGLSLAGLLDDPNDPNFTRDTLYWSHLKPQQDEIRAVREGDFKLIKFIPYGLPVHYELYRIYDENGDNITECPTADFGCDPCDPCDPNCLDCPQANNLYTNDSNYPNDPNYQKSQALKTKLNNWLDSFKPYEQSDPNTRYDDMAEAIDSAENGDTIVLPPARFREAVDITKQITIRSEDPDNPAIVAATVIDWSSTEPTVKISSDNCSLEGVTVTRASECDANGAAIQSDGKSAAITKCIIRDNRTAAGKDGGAIYNVAGTISNCVIINNSAGNHGGAIANCTADIKNCLIANNSADANGGGLYNCSGDIINNTIASNAAQSGGGLSGCTAATITNCIIFSNDPDQLHDSNTPDYSCITGWTTGGTDNISSDPNFISFHNLTDKTTDSNSFNTIKVADAGEYDVNDIIEYDNDGIARTVTGANTLTHIVTFKPQRAFASEPNIFIYNWRQPVDNVLEDYHIDPNSDSPSPCVDAGDPCGGDYYGQTDIDGDQRVMTEKVDIGADEAAYFPSCAPDYEEWFSVGRPNCWCYRRHCRGDTDNTKDGTAKMGYYYVGGADLALLFHNWQVLEPPDGPGIVYLGEPNICADVDHAQAGSPKMGYYRAGGGDLQVMFNNWQILEPPKGTGILPDCLVCSKGKQGAGSPGKDYSTEEMIELLEQIWENDDLVRKLINEQDWQKVIESLKKKT